MQRQMCKTRDYPCEDGLFVLLTSLRDPHSLTHSDQTYVHTRITFRATRREYRNCGGEKKANTSVRRECGTRITLSRLPGMETRFVLYVQQTFSSSFDSFLHVRIAWSAMTIPFTRIRVQFLKICFHNFENLD